MQEVKPLHHDAVRFAGKHIKSNRKRQHICITKDCSLDRVRNQEYCFKHYAKLASPGVKEFIREKKSKKDRLRRRNTAAKKAREAAL